MKVLVVDDDVVSRMVLMHLIDGLGGYEVAEAEDGQEAWELLAGGLRPAVCFCDMRMPRLSGLELLQRIKSEPALKAISVVMVSSANEVGVVQEAQEHGAAGYIVKPFHGEQVRHHLARLVPEQPAAHAAETPQETMQRLGINADRLLAYLGGFDKQVSAATEELPALLAQPGDEARRRIERLLAGCQTLGLHGAAAALTVLGPAPDGAAVRHALSLTAAAVGAQLDSVRRLHAAA
jgi:two-component system chemotaxis response regulator CheY